MADYICTYLCPIRSSTVDEKLIADFSSYWKFLDTLGCDVLVVDGSPQEIFEIHHLAWTHCRHIPVDKDFTWLNGKVNGIMTGMRQALHEKIILADDDIRYETDDIYRMVEGLKEYDVVRPQNFFSPLPWWNKIDTARILINRALIPEGDFPGTFGFRKCVFEAAGPFDGDVLFDNEELIRHLGNFGANIFFAKDFFILRKPPTFRKWLEQRPRQAYEDFVMTKKTALFLSLIPAHGLLAVLGKKKLLGFSSVFLSSLAIAAALRGRKGKAQHYFPLHTAGYAPLWGIERAASIYIALYWRFVKGGYPFGDVLIKKGTGTAWKSAEKSQAAVPKAQEIEGKRAIAPVNEAAE